MLDKLLNMFNLAKIPVEGRNITNRSDKVTLYANLFNTGLDDNVLAIDQMPSTCTNSTVAICFIPSPKLKPQQKMLN